MKKIQTKYSGLWPVMLTPFLEDKKIDFYALDQLTDFYLEAGASGLFANCLSSEMYELSESERLEITLEVVKRAGGKVPVAATGTFGGSLISQAEFIKKVHAQGADVIVIITSQLAGERDQESRLKDNIFRLADSLEDNIRLGLYECPVPYKRILSPGLTFDLASSGRYFYLKDTTCNTTELTAKVKAAYGTPLSVFNANTPTAFDSLRFGTDGLSPISANFYPELYSWMCKNFSNESDLQRASHLGDELTMMDAITRINYPMCAKVFLAKRGLSIRPVIRTAGRNLNEEEGRMLDQLFSRFLALKNELALK